MRAPDKSPAESTGRSHIRGKIILRVAVIAALLGCLASCNRLATPPARQVLKDADTKAAEGEFLQSINLYESGLDGSPKSADVHYRMALLYDDKLRDPLSAMHHFKRYLTLAPAGAHAAEVKTFMKRDELALGTSLSGDSVVSHAEAARLKNENLDLRKQLDDRRATEARGTAAGKENRGAKADKTAAAKAGKHGRSYVVQSGDTLASISRRFYKASGRWKKILQANRDTLSSPGDLKPGQTLVIP
ncbi:MAG: LysM peptidoglycan-binding domain-containing protein [Verrucomicrobiota bacterium]|nr:LysM peptidoglycan-binding domain-containing protein [Verrucomicrobiota bacterium]